MSETGNFPNGHGNRGGNEGNVFGAGNKRKALRKRLLDGADKTAKYWLEVANGNKVIVVPGGGKKPDTTRRPSHEERGKAFETLLRYGLGTQDEVVVLQSADVLNHLADLLPEFAGRTIDAELADELIAALESRVGGQDT